MVELQMVSWGRNWKLVPFSSRRELPHLACTHTHGYTLHQQHQRKDLECDQ